MRPSIISGKRFSFDQITTTPAAISKRYWREGRRRHNLSNERRGGTTGSTGTNDTNFLNNPNWGGLGFAQLKWMWTTHLMGHYIPVTWMTLGLDHIIWDMDPLGYHLTGILLHAANAVLFYFVALALFGIAIPESSLERRARMPLAALFAALVFGLHPLRAESVAWVTERRDLVSGLFYLLAILAYLRALHGAPSPRIWR